MPALSTPSDLFAATSRQLSADKLPPSPFGEFGGPAVPIIAPCLTSGTTVASEGHKTFCVDVEGSELDGTKLVVTLSTPRQSDVVTLGGRSFARAGVGGADGAILEVKPFQQPCEACDVCECVGCGERCECVCGVACKTGGPSCKGDRCACHHTAGVLAPGRWYVAVDAPGAFELSATLVAARSLEEGVPQRSSLLSLDAAASGAAAAADGAAWADYYWVDPKPHESLTIAYETLRAGTPPGWADVYIRSGDWPTTEEHDAMMSADPQLPPSPQFVLHADRLFNERIFVMVVGRGASFVDYTLTANARPSASLALVALVVGAVAVAGACIFSYRRLFKGPEAGEAKPLVTAGGAPARRP